MIDITQETLIPLREAPRLLPSRPNGKRMHISACYRWVTRGVRGVHLEAIRIGGSTYTSREALQRFAKQLGGGTQDADAAERATPRARQQEIERAARAVRSELGMRGPPSPSGATPSGCGG